MTKTPRIEIFEETNKKGRAELGFRVRSKNGRTIVSATGYNTFQGAQKSVDALKEIMTGKFVVTDLRTGLKRKPSTNGHTKTVKLPASRRTKATNGRKTSTKSTYGAAV
jgi:uncharacterized protein YegP (UPF0339 family)